MTTALSNNLNELDLLLQDLSAARYSGHIQTKETVIESRSYTSHSQFQDVAPTPPERTKHKNKFLDAPDPATGLHAVERSRTEKTTTTLLTGPTLDNGNEESKWEYMGFGIWENREGSTSPSGVAPRMVERTIPIQDRDRKHGYNDNMPGYHGNGYTDNTAGYTDNTAGYTDNTAGYTDNTAGYSDKPGSSYSTDKSPGYLDKSSGYLNKTGYQQDKIVERTVFQDRRSSERISGYQAEPVGASNATQELDELMTSLNNFKMAERQVDEPVIPPNLDTMLGNLQEDMDKQGVKTTQKGVCGACKKPIVGQVITALGYTWHPEHFTCAHCNQELGTSNFFERDGKPYCEQDYHHLFSPPCGFCNGPILDKCISALDKTWHPEHFLCAGCGRPLGEEGFHERGESAYCKTCYFDQFAPKCGGCNTPITENYISSLNQQWHPTCFVCRECNLPFSDGAFFEHEGHPYCEVHYHALRGSLCAGCHKPISGRCITAMFRKFHPEHFVCSFCLKQLNKGTFKEQGDKPYCHECFDRLFG